MHMSHSIRNKWENTKDLTRRRKIARRMCVDERKKDTSSLLLSSFKHEKIVKFGKLEAT